MLDENAQLRRQKADAFLNDSTEPEEEEVHVSGAFLFLFLPFLFFSFFFLPRRFTLRLHLTNHLLQPREELEYIWHRESAERELHLQEESLEVMEVSIVLSHWRSSTCNDIGIRRTAPLVKSTIDGVYVLPHNLVTRTGNCRRGGSAW